MKSIILIDGDNICESYVPQIVKEVGERYVEKGEYFEVHCFGDFVKRKQSWQQACYKYGVQLHYVPSIEKQKKNQPDPNTSDIALTGFAIKRLYEKPDLEVFIIVANDKDYVPLAKMLMEEFGKTAVIFYSEPNDTAAEYYNEAVLLKLENAIQSQPNDTEKSSAKVEKTDADIDNFIIVASSISKQFKDSNSKFVLLAELAPILKEQGIKYGKSIGKYLEKMFTKFPELKEYYTLKTGNSSDRIEKVGETDADIDNFITVANSIAEQLKNADVVLLAELAPILKDQGVKYGNSIGKYLEGMFNKFSVLREFYTLKRGDKKDRIEKVTLN